MLPSPKIRKISEIAQSVESIKAGGKRVVHCHGEFDLLHMGHMRYFKAAKALGDFLIVTLTPDRFIAKGPGRPVFNEELRAEAIANLEFVDLVGINEWETAEETLKTIIPDIYVKGSEYLNKVDVTGRLEKEKKLIESLGGTMQFTHEIIFSSSRLLNNHFNVFSKESAPYLDSLAQHCKAIDIVEKLDKIRSQRILVIGDTRIDRHWFCQSSNDGSIPKLDRFRDQPSGVLSVINVLADYCEQLDCVTIVPKDSNLESQIAEWTPENINLKLFTQSDYEYPNTLQYWENNTHQSLGKVGHRPLSITSETESTLLRWLSDQPSYDMVMIVDLGLGIITKTILEFLEKNTSFVAASISGRDLTPCFNPIENYSKLDHLCLDKSGISSLAELNLFELSRWSNPLPFTTEDPSITLVRPDRGNSYWNHNYFSQLPKFTDKIDSIISKDITNIVFSLSAPLACLGIKPEWQHFVGNAIGEMGRQNKDPILQLERLLLEKFLIALLNR